MRPIPVALAKSLFVYDPETGRIEHSQGAKKGQLAGWKDPAGYFIIYLKRRPYLSHRVAWSLFYGDCPVDAPIDHINLDKGDNRIENLRIATRSGNGANRTVLPNNKLGVKGVDFHAASRRFRSQIKVDGRKIHLGFFDSVDAASSAYTSAAVRYFGNFARAA